mmetsp:Transcript_18257/g.26210  ORF Transcript_18257/g.26210 Transcript_18257/m.26210 type:complete len:248 (-) Transcript_18257:103-846(-)
MTNEINELRDEIKKVQAERRLAQLRHKRVCQARKSENDGLSDTIARLLRQRLNPIYDEAMEERMGPMFPRPAEQLLEMSHMCENAEKLLDLTVKQWRKQTDYMVCEINVLNSEKDELKNTYAQKSASILEEINRIASKANKPFHAPESKRKTLRPASSSPSLSPSASSSSFAIRKPKRLSTFRYEDDDASIGSIKTYKSSSTCDTHQLSLDDDEETIDTRGLGLRNTSCAFASTPLMENEELEVIEL